MKYLITLLLITNLCFGQEWSKAKLNDFSSINFPSPPDTSESNGGLYFTASDSTGVYMVMVKDLGNPKITESELSQLYQGVISGALKSVNGELIKQNEFQLNGIKGIEMLFTANSNPQLPNLRDKRIIVVNNNIISYEFWTYKETEQIASINKERFFNSISVSIKKDTEPSKNEAKSAYEIGFKFGKIISNLLLIGLVIGGVFLIRNMNKKKNKNIG